MNPLLKSRLIWTLGQVALALSLAGSTPSLAHPGLDEVIADLTRRIQQDTGNADLHLRRAEAQRQHRNWPAAEADYREARRLNPELYAVDLALGRMMLESDRPTEAKDLLDRFLTRQPAHPEGLALRARALVRLGRPLEAAEDFSRALASAPPGHRSRVDFFHERARALESAGPDHYARALSGLDQGITELNAPITLQLQAIELAVKLKSFDAALARIDEGAARSARKESWLLRRGEVLELAGRHEQARQAYVAVLEAVNNLPVARKTNRAMQELQTQAQSALKRLDTSH